jgi:hypothetical protein
MNPKITMLAALLLASPLPARAACTPTRSASEAANQEPKTLVPFAVPIGLPVATFAPYFYSAAQFQPSPASTTDKGPRTTDLQSANQKGPNNLVAMHCSSCHSGPSPKAGLALDHRDALSLTDCLRAIRAIASGQMPKGSQLSDQEIRALIQELTPASP